MYALVICAIIGMALSKLLQPVILMLNPTIDPEQRPRSGKSDCFRVQCNRVDFSALKDEINHENRCVGKRKTPLEGF